MLSLIVERMILKSLINSTSICMVTLTISHQDHGMMIPKLSSTSSTEHGKTIQTTIMAPSLHLAHMTRTIMRLSIATHTPLELMDSVKRNGSLSNPTMTVIKMRMSGFSAPMTTPMKRWCTATLTFQDLHTTLTSHIVTPGSFLPTTGITEIFTTATHMFLHRTHGHTPTMTIRCTHPMIKFRISSTTVIPTSEVPMIGHTPTHMVTPLS